MSTPVIEFAEVTLSPLFSDGARGGEIFRTSIIGNRYSITQRNIGTITPPRKWHLDFKHRSADELEELREFFNSKFGCGIGFRFHPPSDFEFRDDVIGVGTGSSITLPLKRTYTGGSQTMERRIVKPNNQAIRIYYNGVFQVGMGLGDEYSIDTTTGELTISSSPPGNGVTVSVAGGDFCVPVVFDTDTFESTDMSTISDWSGVGLVEILPANLGIT